MLHRHDVIGFVAMQGNRFRQEAIFTAVISACHNQATQLRRNGIGHACLLLLLRQQACFQLDNHRFERFQFRQLTLFVGT